MNRTMRLFVSTALALGGLLGGEAGAQEEEQACTAAQPMTGNRLLRRLSLDLRARVPTIDEIEVQRGVAEVDEAKIETYLRSPEFTQVMRRYHASLLWPNIDQVELVPDTHELFPYELAPGDPVYLSAVRAVFTRAAPGAGNLYVPCKNEPAQFDQNGDLIVEPLMMGEEIVGYQEGYVMVEPYWAPGTQVKVCALDALSQETAPVCPGPVDRYPFAQPICDNLQGIADQLQTPFSGTEVSCSGPLAILAPGCGCGENLRHCQSPGTGVQIRNALLEQMGRIVDRVIENDRPYQEILTDPVMEMNGPVSHYLRYQSRLNFDLMADVDDTLPVPDIAYTDTAWRPVTRTGRHAGVLTTPGYLLRFTTNRGRAHRYYNAFECGAFIPSGPLPSPFEPCSQHEDLTKRCGCDACHQALEPMAAHWGRFAEYGFGHLDLQRFPTQIDQSCIPPYSDIVKAFACFRQYELDPVGEEIPYQGQLNAYVFRTPEERQYIEQGPERLANEAVASGRFASCTTRKMWAQLMRRDPTSEEAAEVLPALEASFEESGYNLRTLVKEIVTQPAYGRQP